MNEAEDIVTLAKTWLEQAEIPYDEIYVSSFCTDQCGDMPRPKVLPG